MKVLARLFLTAVMLGVNSASAALIIITTSTNQSSPFIPNWPVATDSLIAGMSPSSVGAGSFTQNYGGGAGGGVAKLTDGALGQASGDAGPDATCGYDNGAGAYVIYTLPATPNGYNITNITTYAGWQDNALAGQQYAVSYSTQDNPTSFVFLTFVNYAPAGSTPTASRVVLAGFLGGTIAANVAAIKFDFTTPLDLPYGVEAYDEITVEGTPAATLTPQPVVITTSNQNSGSTFVPSWTVETGSLIAGVAPSVTIGDPTVSPTAGTPFAGASALTDGNLGVTGDYSNCAALGSGGGACASLIYTLTGSTNGYDLTNIVTYTGWIDYGRDGQFYTVSYSTVALPTIYVPLTTVECNAYLNPLATASANRVAITSKNGVLAKNVYRLKFDFPQDNSIDYGFGAYTEIVVQGTKSAPLPVTVSLNHFPKPMQLYQRNLTNGLANVLVDGSVTSTGATQVVVSVLRNGALYTNVSQSLTYANGVAPFSITSSILAELASYSFTICVVRGGTNYLVVSANDVVAGDAFMINGQSNAEAGMRSGSANGNQHPYLRSFGTRDENGATVGADLNWHLAEGDAVTGPGAVGQWGLRLGRLIIDTYGIPVAIINGSHGGWPITSFQRNDANPQDLNTDYGRTLYRATQAGLQNGLRAILWYQGESDMSDADAHEKGWTALHGNWLTDYAAVRKFYVFQLHVGCYVSQFDTDLRNRQRLLADHFNDVEVMATSAVGTYSDDCHYPYVGGYELHATNIFRLVRRDLYAAAPQNNIEAPNPYYACFSAPAHNQITLVMRNANDTLTFSSGAEADFRLEGSSVVVTSGAAVGNKLVLTLSGDASAATGLSYGAHDGAPAPTVVNANGVGLLAFYNLPIQPGNGASGVPTKVASLAISANRVDITWAAATNVAEYLIRRNGVIIGQTPLTVFSDSTVTSGPVYTYDVAAIGLVSTSAWSSVTSVTTLPDNVFALVPEATNYTILYRLDIPNDLRLGSALKAPYGVDNSALMTQPFDRVAYCLELQTNPGQPLNWVYVSCDPFSRDPKLLGVPAVAAGGVFHQPITNLNVYASAGTGIATGSGLGVGNIEFWGWSYTQNNAYGVPGASDTAYDTGDAIDVSACYGSMQIHRAGQTLFAYNSWGAYTADSGYPLSGDDLGLGTQATGSPDWTFAANAFRYSYKRLYVLVRPVAPAFLGYTHQGSLLQLSWPVVNAGWRLQVQSNSLSTGLSTNWIMVTGSNVTNQVTMPIGSTAGSVFFRLIYP
ncbi:MAG: sialate O-acetylesterase [Verrucomicrobiae bacterium]|nr:sialate O-acetylesterase [Verrucomicrobiae bacterium]